MPTIYIGADGAHCIHEDGYDEAINYPDPLDAEQVREDRARFTRLMRTTMRNLSLAGICGITLVLVAFGLALLESP